MMHLTARTALTLRLASVGAGQLKKERDGDGRISLAAEITPLNECL